MKKLMIVLVASGLFSVFQVSNSFGQIEVSVRPVEPTVVVEAPPRPSAGHVWIKPRWGWNPGARRYEWLPGEWMLPPHPHAVWVEGFWRAHGHGWVWVPGHWGRRR